MESSTVYTFPRVENVHRLKKFRLVLIRFITIPLVLFGTILLVLFLIKNNYLDNNSNTFIEIVNLKNESLIDNWNVSDIILTNVKIDFPINKSLNVIEECAKSPFDEEFVKTLSPDERMIVEQIKNDVIFNLSDDICEVHSEFYIVRWLKHNNWDIEEAQQAFLNTLQWRKDYRVNELFTEDFTYLEEVFPFYTDGQDYTGRMVITADMAAVNLKKILLAGKGKTLVRYLTRAAESGLKYTREAQLKGKNVTQMVLIANFQGFNIEQHGCDLCMAFLRKFFYLLKNYYPGAFHKIFIINTPALEFLFELVKLVVSSDVIESFEIFGTNKREWKEAILKLIPAKQIRSQFGGTKEMNYD